MTMKAYSLPPLAGNPVTSVVVFLHGYGANGEDLLDLGREWQALLPNTLFISPDAPFPCDMSPLGRQWFSLADYTPPTLEAGARHAAPILNAFLDKTLTEYGLDDSALALVGFSQGTMMALFTALRRAKQCAGIVGYSGALLAPESLSKELESKPPVLLIHGEIDMVVPCDASVTAKATLDTYSVPCTLHTLAWLPHSIDHQGIKWGGEFLQKVLKK